ncbi:MAG: hypothetical protein HRT44_02100, partial [Bdellovibrionales bacterium]|nr:ABC transporter substrate-binding protein [Bdellovibrionales bacterium]NQZ18039.1 hypothetical protein [Bdellovibrionales bacterium]
SMISFNYKNELGSNIKFREALSLALNREMLFSDNKQIRPTHELIPSMYLGRSETKFEYNPAKAKEIIEKYFKNQISKTKPIKAIFHGKPGKENNEPVLTLQSQLEKAGIYVEFEGREWVRFDNDRSIVFREVGKGATFTDPVSSFASYIAEDKSKNEYTVLNDKKSFELFNKAKTTSNREAKAKYLRNLTKHFQKQYRVLPTGEIRNSFVYKKSKIKAIGLFGISSSIDFNKVKMRK